MFAKRWLIVFSSIILAATLWFSLTTTDWKSPQAIFINFVVSPISALTGVVCVVLCAKGHISNWVWGLINSIAYGALALVSGYYGDWMINWFFFVPTQFFIFFVWRKRVADTGVIPMKKLTRSQGAAILGVVAVVTVLFAFALKEVDSWFITAMKRNISVYKNLETVVGSPMIGPLLDSAVVWLQVAAEIMLILCYSNQWKYWVATNVISILIWGTVIVTDPSSVAYSVPTLIMWVAYLVNSGYGLYIWKKGAK